MCAEWNRVFVVGGGANVPPTPPDLPEDTLIISADSGAGTLRHWQLQPHWIVGDMDSIREEDYVYWKHRGVAFRTFPAEKDATDMELAIDYAWKEGIRTFLMTGAWGGRMDHSLGNVELMYALARKGATVRLLTDNGYAEATDASWQDELPKGRSVSLLPLTPQVRGVTTIGLKYPLSKADLVRGTTLGISNESLGGYCSVGIKEGVLLVMICQESDVF